MSNTSDDMLDAAKGSEAAAAFSVEQETDKKSKWDVRLRREVHGRRRSRFGLSVVLGGSLLVAAIIWFTQRDGEESGATGVEATTTTTHPSTTPEGTATCRGEPCTVLQVEGTLETPGGEGVWIRSCFDDSPCERRALAAEHQQIYAVCRVDAGKVVFGDTVWVKTPWASASESIPQDQPVRAEATGHSDRESQEYGWATAYYLTPRAAIDALPLCTT